MNNIRETYYTLRRRFPELKELSNWFEGLVWQKVNVPSFDGSDDCWEKRVNEAGDVLWCSTMGVVVKLDTGEVRVFDYET